MQDSVTRNDYYVSMVCVDSYEDSVMKGHFACPYLEDSQSFTSFMDFVIKMECLMDVVSLPGNEAARCGFQWNLPDGMISSGKMATFSLTILFRQNNTWHGTITWLDTSKTQNFRSVLELIALLDSALKSEQLVEA